MRSLLVSSALALAQAWSVPTTAQAPPRVLTVIAHPDDDAMFAGTVYKLTHALGAAVDLALVTDGSGGFRYSQLAEPIYGLQLTDETVARQYLPTIRKRELMAGGAITGIRKYFFLDQLDHAYTENVDSVLRYVWDSTAVRTRLRTLLEKGRYDYVFVHLPIERVHGHHNAASILALEAARSFPEATRPVVLGAFIGRKGDTTLSSYRELVGYPITRVRGDLQPFVIDLTQPLTADGRLDYRIVVNWLIAEHKSQGTMQLLVNGADLERYWYFATNSPSRLDATRRLFTALHEPFMAGISRGRARPAPR